MKIIQFTEDYRPNIGGIATHVYEIAKIQKKQGHEVYVLTTTIGDKEDPEYVLRIGSKIINMLPRKIANALYTIKCRNIISRLKPDVYHWHTYNGIGPVLASLINNKIKKVLTNHSSGFLFDHEKGRVKYLKKKIGIANLVLAPSVELTDISKLYTNSNCVYIPNGVNPGNFYSLIEPTKFQLRTKLHLPTEAIIGICPRRAVKKNGVEYLIRATELAKEKKLVIVLVGDGDEVEELKEIASQVNVLDQVIFCGAIENSKMIEYFNASDFCVLPSLKEATSIAGLEAMACSLPLVGTRVGGIPELIEDGLNGFLCNSKDVEGLSKAINKLIANKNMWEKYSKYSREKVIERYTWDRIGEITSEQYMRG